MSIGARGLTGKAYKGHVFWDTEIFMLPFFTLTYPEAARALLMYRYHTLPAARAKAARLGYRGALYAWESADTGEEVTPPFVSLPTARSITDPAESRSNTSAPTSLTGSGATGTPPATSGSSSRPARRSLIETARFWASRAEREDDGRYHIAV